MLLGSWILLMFSMYVFIYLSHRFAQIIHISKEKWVYFNIKLPYHGLINWINIMTGYKKKNNNQQIHTILPIDRPSSHHKGRADVHISSTT